MSDSQFLILFNGMNPDFMKRQSGHSDYQNNSFKSAGILKVLSLIDADIPIAPRAFVLERQDRGGREVILVNSLVSLVSRFETLTQRNLGKKGRPLLLTVRGTLSGSIRGIGVCPDMIPDLFYYHGPEVACSIYIDFLDSYTRMVLGAADFDFKTLFGIGTERDPNKSSLKDETSETFYSKVVEYRKKVAHKLGRPFSENPELHLMEVLQVFLKNKQLNRGEEITIQVQCLRTNYGQSTQGIFYTRNPFSGEKDLYGAFQSGPEGKKGPLDEALKSNVLMREGDSLRSKFPLIYDEILKKVRKIETIFKEVMEVSFVSDDQGSVILTEFESAELTPRAAVVSTVELNEERVISDREAVLRLKGAHLEMLLHPTLDESSRAELVDLGSSGISAAPGTTVGRLFFKMQDAIEFYQQPNTDLPGLRSAILMAHELLISDTPGLSQIHGLITQASGVASHAAVMARANGIPCIVGYQNLEIDPQGHFCQVNGKVVRSGDVVTLEAGVVGRLSVGAGRLKNVSFEEGVVQKVSQLLTQVARAEALSFEVRVNINNSKDSEVGLNFGAAGVGLCRTENLFADPKALREIRNIVFTDDVQKCAESFRVIEDIQFQEFQKIFEVMKSRTVNIRLMDLPLHDFVPRQGNLDEILRDLPHLIAEQIMARAEKLKEQNPMLGLRACRFGLILPEVYDLQIRAIVRAAYSVEGPVDPGIMFPLVLLESELRELKNRVLLIEEQVRKDLRIPLHSKINVRVGSMIELPGAALSADHLARVGEFFAFGTNDLTQTTLGMSRDDSAHYLPHYLEKGYLSADPFKVLAEPVRELIETAVTRGRRVRPEASYGICGEQGGDLATLEFCINHGLDYVSCSPFRVLPTLLAAVQIELKKIKELELGIKSDSDLRLRKDSVLVDEHEANKRQETKY